MILRDSKHWRWPKEIVIRHRRDYLMSLPIKMQLNCAEKHLQISTSTSKMIEAHRIGDIAKRVWNTVIFRADHSTPSTRYLFFKSFLNGCFRRSNPPCWYQPKQYEMGIACLTKTERTLRSILNLRRNNRVDATQPFYLSKKGGAQLKRPTFPQWTNRQSTNAQSVR
jgi:hypothetical protein